MDRINLSEQQITNWLYAWMKAGNDVISILTSEDTRVLDVVCCEFYEWCIFQWNTHVYVLNK